MSDIRKWLKIMEGLPGVFPEASPKIAIIKQDATVMVNPSKGGGIARYMHSTPNGAMVDIKGIARELSHDDFSLPDRDYEDTYQKGNDWFHMNQNPDTIGSLRDKPEFTSGDMVKVADVYGTVIGPGFGVFIAYGTTGQDAVISFDGKEILVPIENIGAALEQNAKDNFGQMDNDGALSPMSRGSENVKIEQPLPGMSAQEPEMDHRDEFSKWIAAVEGVLKSSNEAPLEEHTEMNNCGCGNWDCNVCFPNDEEQIGFSGEGELSFGDEPEIAGEVCPTCGHECEGHDSDMHDLSQDEHDFEVMPIEGGFDAEFGEEGSAGGCASGGIAMDEEENEFTEKPKSGKGVKLGSIVQKTEFRKTGGRESPLTYGDSLEEDGEDRDQLIGAITSMQDMGISKDDHMYFPGELESLAPEALRQCYSRAMGEMSEETKPTKAKTYNHLDDLEDLFAPKQDNFPAMGNDEEYNDEPAPRGQMELPTASRSSTQSKTRTMTPTDSMRDLMNRMDSTIGDTAPDLPDTPTTDIAVRTASDVPAVISSAMQATGTQSPEWHQIRNLPGMNDRSIRAMGRGMFGTMTSTPVEDIKTIANVNGQGPNSEAEVRAVANWLRQNADDLGDVEVSHGQAMPGYNAEAHDYVTDGVRFHVVRDQFGSYIYAYPDKDARVRGDQSQEQGAIGGRGNMPRLGESAPLIMYKPTLFEHLKWDEEIDAVLKEAALDEEEIDESTLSKHIGKDKGGQKLVQWLHRKHKLSNEADLSPAPFSKRLLWKEYKRNPDNFIIVSAENGVAGIKPYEKHIQDRMAAAQEKGKEYDPGNDSTLPYQIIAFTDDGAQVDPALLRPAPKNADGEEKYADPTVMKARMGLHTGKETQNPDNVFNLLADQIGRLKTVWVTGAAGTSGDEHVPFQKGAVERDKMAKRGEMKKTSVMSDQQALEQIFKKVRPVLKTLGNQAVSQINRSAQRYIAGGNYEAASKIAKSGEKLKQFLVTLDTSGDINLDSGQAYEFTNAIRNAVQKASGSYRGSPEYTQWVNDAAKGNSVALKPILDALRDTLVALT